jgi:hypothetical protein
MIYVTITYGKPSYKVSKFMRLRPPKVSAYPCFHRFDMLRFYSLYCFIFCKVCPDDFDSTLVEFCVTVNNVNHFNPDKYL